MIRDQRSQIPLILALLIGLGAGGVVWGFHASYRAANERRVERLVGTATQFLDDGRDQVERLALDYAQWDDVWVNLVESPSSEWAHENIGPYLTREQQVRTVALVDGGGRIRRLIRDGIAADPAQADMVLERLAGWVAMGAGDRLSGTALLADRMVHVGAAQVTGHAPEVRAKAAQSTPVWLVFLRDAELDRLARATGAGIGATAAPPDATAGAVKKISEGLARVRLDLVQPGPAEAGRVALVIRDTLPGRQLLFDLGPFVAGALLVLVVLGAWGVALSRRDAEQRAILERQRAALEAGRVALVEAAEAKARYHNAMAHELRTPLSVILTSAEMLADREALLPDAERSPFVRLLILGARQLHGMVDDLLDLARLQAGRLAQAPEEVDVGATVATVVAGLVAYAAEGGVALEIEPQAAAEDRPDALGYGVGGGVVRTDPRLLERLTYNLVTGTLSEAMPGDVVAVSVAVASEADEVRISAWRDRPEGLLPVRRTQRSVRQGAASRLGLGIAYCRAVLDELGGRVEEEGGRTILGLPVGRPDTRMRPPGMAGEMVPDAPGLNAEAPSTSGLATAGLATAAAVSSPA